MERTLYDAKGHPIAYIADDGERSIYLWSGHPVAYIDDRLNCHGWNGRHLGWIEDGILFDTEGLAVGYMRPKGPGVRSAEPEKGVKSGKAAKAAKCPAGAHPPRRKGPSSLALGDFLKAGAVGPI